MKPKYPHTQPFDQLPEKLPLYVWNNALLPGGELPLEIADEKEMAIFFDALRSDQMIGIVQPQETSRQYLYPVGCAGRIRQYRERKDGRINVMLTGFCRFRIAGDLGSDKGYGLIKPDWSEFAVDYETPEVDSALVNDFMQNLRTYFQGHQMQADWETLGKAHIEEVVNNLVLVMQFSPAEKQRLLEALTIQDRITVFNDLLVAKSIPTWSGNNQSGTVN